MLPGEFWGYILFWNSSGFVRFWLEKQLSDRDRNCDRDKDGGGDSDINRAKSKNKDGKLELMPKQLRNAFRANGAAGTILAYKKIPFRHLRITRILTIKMILSAKFIVCRNVRKKKIYTRMHTFVNPSIVQWGDAKNHDKNSKGILFSI